MRASTGFTLVELLVVFAIGAILVALVPPAFDRMQDSARYRETLGRVLADLRAARHSAQAEGRDAVFSVNLQERTYRLDTRSVRSIPAGLDVRVVVAETQFASEGIAAIRFFPDGGASGGSVDILRTSGTGARLRVDWLTGRVTQESIEP